MPGWEAIQSLTIRQWMANSFRLFSSRSLGLIMFDSFCHDYELGFPNQTTNPLVGLVALRETAYLLGHLGDEPPVGGACLFFQGENPSIPRGGWFNLHWTAHTNTEYGEKKEENACGMEKLWNGWPSKVNTITGEDWKRSLAIARKTPNSISLQIKEVIAKMNTYRIRYKRNDCQSEQIADRQGASPISVLGFLHRELQLQKNLKPSEYEITSVSLYYPADAYGRTHLGMIESPYDLPNTPNPDLKHATTQNSPAQETQTMPFFDEAKSTKPDAGV